MIKIDNSKKIIILTSITLLTVISIIVFVLLPLNSKIKTFNKEIYDKRVQLAIYQQQRENIESTRSDYSNIKSDIKNISKIFIDKNNFLGFISTLEEIAITNQVTQNIHLNISTQSEIQEIVSVSISLGGEWKNILNYMLSLEKLDYYVNIFDLTLTKNIDNVMEAVIVANVYTQ